MRTSWVVLCTVVLAWFCGRDAAAQVGFDTGAIHGTIKSNGGDVPPNAMIEVRPVGSFGGISAWVDNTGAYSAVGIPVGSYEVVAFYSGFEVGRFPLTVTAGVDVEHDFRFAAGIISVHVERNGVDDQGAGLAATNVDIPPGCFAPGATCQPGSTIESCACTIESRFYTCHPGMGCRYMNMATFFAHTDASGVARLLVPAGLYDIGVASSSAHHMPHQQSGQIRIAMTSSYAVADLSDAQVLDVSYQTGTLTGTITINGAPMTGALVEARTEFGMLVGPVDASGVYTIEAPVGTYTLAALQDGSTSIGVIENVVVTANTSTPNNFALTGAQVSGSVVRDGMPAVFAPILFQLHPPTQCVPGECNIVTTTEPCSCSRAGQAYFCHPDVNPGTMRCNWIGGGMLSTYADGAGNFSKFLQPGTYDVAVGTAHEMGVFGTVAVGRVNGVVVDTAPVNLGSFSYATGTVSGALTSCGVPVPNAYFMLSSANGSLSSDGMFHGGGAFSIRAPEGDYTLHAEMNGSQLANTSVTIAAATPATWNPNLELGAVRGTLRRDGQPSTFSPVMLTEIAEGISCNDDCFLNDPAGGTCFGCSANGRDYACINFQPCRYNQQRYYQGSTDTDGVYTISNIVPGLYHIILGSGGGSPMPGGQGGSIVVGEFDVRVNACELSEVNLSDASVTPGPDQTVSFVSGVELTFDNVTTAGTVSYQTTSTPPPAAPTPSFQSAGLFYDIFVPDFTGTVELCLPYDVDTAPADVHLYHHDDVLDRWVDITTSVDAAAHIVCGVTSSFSWFAVGTDEIIPPTLTITGPTEVTADASCDGRATLTGAGSYRWYRDGQLLDTGTSVTVTDLVLGPNVITAESGTQSGSFTVTLVDRTAPTLAIVASPALLWPANGKLVSVGPSGTIADNCDVPPAVTIAGVTNPGLPTDVVNDGSTVQLRAFRDGKETAGRTYAIEYAATDRAGNRTTATVTVRVPHDRR